MAGHKIPHAHAAADLQANLRWLAMQAADAYARGDLELGAHHDIAYHETLRLVRTGS